MFYNCFYSRTSNDGNASERVKNLFTNVVVMYTGKSPILKRIEIKWSNQLMNNYSVSTIIMKAQSIHMTFSGTHKCGTIVP